MAKKISHQHSCAAFWVKGVAETLKSEGLDVAALFHEARLDNYGSANSTSMIGHRR
jgi:hypothetical protein